MSNEAEFDGEFVHEGAIEVRVHQLKLSSFSLKNIKK